MGQTLTYKILKEHLVEGELKAGTEIGIRIDQTLTQDATGTMAYLQFEAMGIPQVKTELSVSYVDHNTLQMGFENADDHRYLQTMNSKYSISICKLICFRNQLPCMTHFITSKFFARGHLS